MAEFFDARTAILVLTMLCGLMALVLNSLRTDNPDAVKGLSAWTLATALAFVTALLFGMRGFLPNIITIVVANGLLLLVYALFLMGSHDHFGVTMRWRYWVLGWVVCMAGVVWFTYVQASFSLRSVFMQIAMLAVNAYHARFLYSASRRVGQERSLGIRLTVLSLLVLSFVVFFRLLHLLLVSQDDMDLYSDHWIQSAYTLTYSMVLMVFTVGFILMTTERLREAFQYQAAHDALTGLLNRRYVLDLLNKEISRSQRHKRPFALMTLDLDHFKEINDKHGHLVGDEVLRLVVGRMLSTLRTDDVLGRVGGEEFLLVLPETGKDAALVVAERVLATVSRPVPGLPKVSVSIGLAVWGSEDTTVDLILDRSDRALYVAKSKGRGRVEMLEG
jgi:diguanylate cyclase (GGDEF)-like protein